MLDTSYRTAYNEDHEAFRDTVRKVFAEHMTPFLDQHEEEGIVPRSAWKALGEAGMLCPTVKEENGGLGLDFGFNCVLCEELSYLGSSAGFTLQNDITANYIERLGTEEQRQKYLPGMVSGDIISAIAMTEPGAGSDLQGIRTTAIKDGNHLVVNGSKTYITNGQNADVIIVVAKTDPAQGAKGTSLVLVDADTEGFERGHVRAGCADRQALEVVKAAHRRVAGQKLRRPGGVVAEVLHVEVFRFLQRVGMRGHQLVGRHHAGVFVGDFAGVHDLVDHKLARCVDRYDRSHVGHAVGDGLRRAGRANEGAAPDDVEAKLAIGTLAQLFVQPDEAARTRPRIRPEFRESQLARLCLGRCGQGRRHEASRYNSGGHKPPEHVFHDSPPISDRMPVSRIEYRTRGLRCVNSQFTFHLMKEGVMKWWKTRQGCGGSTAPPFHG